MSGDILDQIDHALGDRAVSGDAMRWTPVEPAPQPREGFWHALDAEVGRRLTAVEVQQQRRQHLMGGVREESLMLLWPEHWVSLDHREHFASGSTLLGLRLALAVIDRPMVVALPLVLGY